MSTESITLDDPRPAAAAPPVTRECVTLAVENMHCGGCMRGVERALDAVPGVESARANLSAKRVTAVIDTDRVGEERLVAALAEAGFRAAPLDAQPADAATARDKDLLWRVAVAGFAAANIMLLSVSVWAGLASDMAPAVQSLFHWLSALIALPAVAIAGQPFYRSAAAALSARRLNMDVPISLAVVLATAMSLYQTTQSSDQVYFDAAVTLLFFLLIGRWLDNRVRLRARGVAHNLLGLKGQFATVITADATEQVSSRLLRPGMRVLVAAGQRVPADGVVRDGRSDIDESLITGETLPRTLVEGEPVYAGTLNLSGALTVEVSAAEDDSLLAEIARLMAAAEQGRARYVRLADRAARIYAPAVHLLGALTFAGWLLAGAGWESALTIAIAVLIITCPCALALAVPAVQVAAASRLFERGILLKSPDALERLAECDHVVFDKTGTLTLGRPRLARSEALDTDLLRRAARLAAASRHPYARAVVQAAEECFGPIAPAAGVEEVAGAGLVRGQPGQDEERVGSPTWCDVPEQRAEQASVWYRSGDGEPIPFRFEDPLRPDAAEAVSTLQSAGLGVELVSGDRQPLVDTVAERLGIGRRQAAASPKDKIDRLERIAEAGQRVAMIGDGLNDAPSLAAAHASMSPVSAADISQTAADVVFQGEALAPVVETLAVARRARRMAFQNFAVALAYNAVCVPLAVAGAVTPLVAAIAMSTSSILVTANALRLRSAKVGLAS